MLPLEAYSLHGSQIFSGEDQIVNILDFSTTQLFHHNANIAIYIM